MQADLETRAQRALPVAIVIGAAATVLAVCAWALAFHALPWGSTAEWALFAGYVDSLTSPVLTLCTIGLVAYTLQASRSQLAAARDQLAAVRDQAAGIQKQLELLQANTKLAELQKRLDGALNAWQSALALGSFTGPGGTDADRIPVEYEATPFAHVLYGRFVEEDILRGAKDLRFRIAWDRAFNDCVNVLEEIDDYCCEYDQAAGNTVLTTFYRKRVQLPAAALRAADLLRPERAARFMVGRNRGDIGRAC